MANAATFLMQRIILVLVLAVPLRAAVLWALSDDLVKDVDGYRELAVNLRQHGTFGWADPSRSTGIRPTAFRPPLYPVLLAPLVTSSSVSPLAAGLLHFVMGMATISLVYATARRWGLGRWSTLAALLTALDPILLHQSAQIMTETLAALLSAAGMFLLTQLLSPGLPMAKGDRREPEFSGGRPDTAPLASAASIVTWPEKWRGMLAGAVLGLSVLARPTFLPWLALVLGAVLMGPPFRTRRARVALTVFAAAAGVLLPWGARNFYHFGQWKLTTTHGGYTLLLANNPGFYRYLAEAPWGAVWTSEALDAAWQYRHLAPDPGDIRWNDLALLPTSSPRAAKGGLEDEFADDQLAYALALRFAREQPLLFAYSCLVRVGRLWGVMPHAGFEQETTKRTLRYAVAVWYTVLFAFALWGLVTGGRTLFRWPWICGILLCLTFTLVHAFYWTDLRMRAPLMPFLAIAAAAGAGRLASRSE